MKKIKGTQEQKKTKGTSNLYTIQELIENAKKMKNQKPTKMIDLYEFKIK